jgi:tRNA pseudouridine55 synthase
MTHPLSPEGLLVVDKPAGITSHDVVQQIRRLSRIRRVGHAGTLDPLATGVLLVCLGRATRLIEYLVGQPKTYVGVVRLGQKTDTYDAEGEVTQTRPVTVGKEDIAAALNAFRGRIEQVPPLYSALKKEGQPLYKLARQGQIIDVPARPVTIYELEILAWDTPDVTLRVVCSAGTYIRSLAHDLGEQLGCGGHLVALRRTAVGMMTVDAAAPLASLTPDNWSTYLHSPETAVAHLPRLDLTNTQVDSLGKGQHPLREPDQPVALLMRGYDERGRFWGIISPWQTSWKVEKLIPPE